MAHLNKLAIRGIRSFDDKQIAVIEFFSPVTVIVGANGSGKTTIIECLKYATTGDQPPNSRGGAFIHDPKMANEKEVKAQVKLRFFAANGKRMLAVRNLSVTMKKTAGMTMKTLESILAIDDNDKTGKRAAISTKCAEIDVEIPHLLGVSKAVLENVIFCHQEESYWPLAEPSILKKKFDDIFEATRYTKALDSIKTLRKDRTADLKAEKERLQSLALQKTHADKLSTRISELNSTIAAKELEYEQAKKEYELLVVSNQHFQNLATKFREIYVKVEQLQERKQRYEAELAEAKENTQVVEGTDEDLQARLRNFDEHINEQKQKKKSEDNNRADLEDDLSRVRREHVNLSTEQGELVAEAKAHEQTLADREVLIRAISEKHNIKGYDHSPLERDQILTFITKLGELQTRQRQNFEKLQNESRSKNEEYNRKSRKLHAELEGLKQQKTSLREQIAERHSSIASSEARLDESQTLPSELRTLQADIEEKKERITKIRSDMQNGKFTERLEEKLSKGRTMEDRRDTLNAEIRSLSLQADTRARLDIKRSELRNKESDLKNTLESINPKFRKLIGVDARAESMERDIERVLGDKERELSELESETSLANKALQQVEATLSGLKTQLKAKEKDLRSFEKKVRDGLENHDNLDAAISEATIEFNIRKEESGSIAGASKIYENLLRVGKAKKICSACSRHMDDKELAVFEKYLTDQMKKSSPDQVKLNKQEMADWEEELQRLQTLMPFEASRVRIKNTEIPALEQQVKTQEAILPNATAKAEKASDKLNELKKEIREISTMKQHGSHVSRTAKDVERLIQEIGQIEAELATTGSTKTADDVQVELDTLSADMRTNEREKQVIMNERESLNNALRNHEKDMYSLEMRENNLQNQIREKTLMEERLAAMKKEIVDFTARLKDLDSKILEAQGPIEKLDRDHQETERDLNNKTMEAQSSLEESNRSVDHLNSINKVAERYVRERRGRKLQECADQIAKHEQDIKELNLAIETARSTIAKYDKEINESDAAVAKLRENLRMRRLANDIVAVQKEIDSYDMEEAARSRRNYDEKYKIEKQRETEKQTEYAHIGGELSSHKAQLKTWQNDLKEFKDAHKKYTEQLLKVKMSEMANSDLEKYAKALENAIMKYHSLKMEEVNDTMRHLWNKTYQGTDIDGIKIRSDVEGGASKRSYNYRVVMTKDQVEMDMRGRCSAGQKMLASIIIRLALSDSFGQNCGILALDEPTNALDVDNIDALAASLVDIINERKNHSNFQLIIITHDESFLRKLGQSDVMEYYWRVSRDARQKSVIERQRFL